MKIQFALDKNAIGNLYNVQFPDDYQGRGYSCKFWIKFIIYVYVFVNRYALFVKTSLNVVFVGQCLFEGRILSLPTYIII